MAIETTGEYLGNKKVRLVHGPSGAELYTAAPIDNNGDGSSFSPTDLVAAALGACTLTVIGIVAERNGIDVSGMSMRVEKHMHPDPRRIARLPIAIRLPANLTDVERTKLERAAHACPVARSLGEHVAVEIEFEYA